ncbi:hypothetical protein OsI_31996 [Oryza sativa Indica Group]|uniref:BHLH domain-containing protein n=1 Tax=Oryza sativa subsp. indica TaxID=39946 RepID=A2Z2Z7_ORYSI|nr:hypothetical protein OsI_31996 [Oryza sativa Indica Group]
MAGFSHLPQQMEHGLITNNGFLFCHGSHGGAATTTAPAIPEDASMETSSVVLDTSPQDKKRKPREEDTASLNSAHSKVRRERISERMRMLQALVPGCDKVTGKALILDEIINYVQSLQNQVEFLSMRIASLSPVLYGFGIDSDAFSDHSQKMEGMFHEAVAIPASVLNRGSSPAQSHAIMDTSNTSPTPYTLQVQGGSNNNSLSQDNGSYIMQTVGEPRQELFNQVVLNNYMCSFQ